MHHTASWFNYLPLKDMLSLALLSTTAFKILGPVISI